MTHVSHPSRPLPRLPRGVARDDSFPARGALALLVLASVVSLVAQIPLRGETLGLLAGVAGSLSVGYVLPAPERRPVLALTWSAMAYALATLLTLAHPALPLGAALSIGMAGGWVALAHWATRTLPGD